MDQILFTIALILMLVASCGFVAFIIVQKKRIFSVSYRVLEVGFAFHTVFLIHNWSTLGILPVLGLKSALSSFAWFITLVYLVFHKRFGLMVLGSFVTPFVAVMMILSAMAPGTELIIKPALKSAWLWIHVLTVFAGDGMFVITFMASIMYLMQERQIKKKFHGSIYSRLPSLESLDAINRSSLIYGFCFLTIGLITGALYAQFAMGSYWQWDPKEVWSMITWLAYAVLLHGRLAVGWRGEKAALLSIACFIVLLFAFIGGGLLFSSYHSFSSLIGGTGS